MTSSQPEEQLENALERNPIAANPYREIGRLSALARRNGTDPLAHIDLAAIEARLKALPVRQRATLRATIERLAPTLLKLKDRGYSVDDLVSELKAVGITVSARGLARHLRAAPPKKTTSALQQASTQSTWPRTRSRSSPGNESSAESTPA